MVYYCIRNCSTTNYLTVLIDYFSDNGTVAYHAFNLPRSADSYLPLKVQRSDNTKDVRKACICPFYKDVQQLCCKFAAVHYDYENFATVENERQHLITLYKFKT